MLPCLSRPVSGPRPAGGRPRITLRAGLRLPFLLTDTAAGRSWEWRGCGGGCAGSVAAGGRRPGALVERLDRIYHWVVHVDARQQGWRRRWRRSRRRSARGWVAWRRSSTVSTGWRAASPASTVSSAELHRDLLAVGRTLAVASEQLAALDRPSVGDGPLVEHRVRCARPARPRGSRHRSGGRPDVRPVGAAAGRRRRSRRRRGRRRPLAVGAGSRSCAATTAVSARPATSLWPRPPGDRRLPRRRQRWHPTYLARVVDALARRADAGWTVAAQLVVRPGATPAVRDDRLGGAALARQNFIDINALAHRRPARRRRRVRRGAGPPRRLDLILRLMAVAGDPFAYRPSAASMTTAPIRTASAGASRCTRILR